MKRLLLAGAMMVFPLLAACDVGAPAPSTTLLDKAGGCIGCPEPVSPPVQPIPVWLGQRCAILTIDQCHALLAYYGY